MSVFKKLSNCTAQCTLICINVHIKKLSLRAAECSDGKLVNNCINAKGVRSVAPLKL